MESKPLDLPKEWVDKIKIDAAPYESATQHEGLGPAIYEDGAMTYAPWLYTCQKNYAALQAKCDSYEKSLKKMQKDCARMTEGTYNKEPLSILKVFEVSLNKALNGEGKKEMQKEIEYMPIHPEDAKKHDCPKRFPIHLLNEARARSNHSQSLQRLKERGGLSVREILAIVGDKPWSYYGNLKWEEAIEKLNAILNQKDDKQ